MFPRTESDSAAVEASRLEGHLIGDEDGSVVNYKSFLEAGDKAQELLDKLHEEGRSDVVSTWSEVLELVGPDATLTRMACIVKEKESGEIKYRLIVDSRRSGVNGLSSVRERVMLPKITDAVAGLNRVRRHLMVGEEIEAFHTLPLRSEDRGFVICKDLHGKYHISRVVLFGLAAGPLLWSRLAAGAMRLAQATVEDGHAAAVCYVDDPLDAQSSFNTSLSGWP